MGKISIWTLAVIFVFSIVLLIIAYRFITISSYGGLNSLIPASFGNLSYNPILYDKRFPLWPDELGYLNRRMSLSVKEIIMYIGSVLLGKRMMLNIFPILTSWMVSVFGYASVLIFSVLSFFAFLQISRRICKLLGIGVVEWLFIVMNPGVLFLGASFLRDVHILTLTALLVLALLDSTMSNVTRLLIGLSSFVFLAVLRLHFAVFAVLLTICLSKMRFSRKLMIIFLLFLVIITFLNVNYPIPRVETTDYLLRFFQAFSGIAFGAWTEIGNGFLLTIEGFAWIYYLLFALVFYLRVFKSLWKTGKPSIEPIRNNMVVAYLVLTLFVFIIYTSILGAFPFRVISPSWMIMMFTQPRKQTKF